MDFKNFFSKFCHQKNYQKLFKVEYDVENFDNKDRINYLKKKKKKGRKKEFKFAQMFEERFKFPETV